MPLPTPAVGASRIGVFSTMAKACETVSARSPAERGRMRHDRNMIPSAASPTMSSGWREFFRVIRLSMASTAAIAPSPATHSAGTSGTPRIDTSPTTTHGRKALTLRTIPATNGTKYPRMPGRKMTLQDISGLRVLPFLVPRHLDRLELRFVRRLRVVVEAVERDDFVAQIGKPNGQRIDRGKFLGERHAEGFRVGPFHR